METRQRIIEATVHLHAECGVQATTYAMIAERADVAIPTVYNHFPGLKDLLGACTGYVSAHAPLLGPQIFDEAPAVETRLQALVRALFAYYHYRARWLRWSVHEAQIQPELAALLGKASELRCRLIALALAPAFGSRVPGALIRLCEILLDFPAWQRLTGNPSLSGKKAETILSEALIALAREYSQGNRDAPPDRRAKPRTKGQLS